MAAIISLNPLKTNALVGWLSDLALRKNQCDGWGFTAYKKSNLIMYFREPTPIWERPPIHFPIADVAVVHVRKASEGSVTFLNSHPFIRVFEGRCWSFCHNGSFKKDVLQKDLKYDPIGETDSEVLFLYILDHLKNLKDPTEILDALLELSKELKERKDELNMSAVNFILTNGSALFALRAARKKEEWFTLCTKDVETKPPLRVAKYSIISSEPLPTGSEDWEPLSNWTLVGRWFEEGELIRKKINL